MRADSQSGTSISTPDGRTVTPVTAHPDTGGGNIVVSGETDAQGANSGLEFSEKEQMEAEMKLMLEKMREYKAKDPSLFLQIWEQVKKVCAFSTTSVSYDGDEGYFNEMSAVQDSCQPRLLLRLL